MGFESCILYSYIYEEKKSKWNAWNLLALNIGFEFILDLHEHVNYKGIKNKSFIFYIIHIYDMSMTLFTILESLILCLYEFLYKHIFLYICSFIIFCLGLFPQTLQVYIVCALWMLGSKVSPYTLGVCSEIRLVIFMLQLIVMKCFCIFFL